MISKKIRQLRSEQGWTQKQLSEKLNVGKTTVSNYETGYSEPDLEILSKISKLFDVSIDYLLGNNSSSKTQDYITINVYGSIPPGIPIEATEDTEDLSLKEYDGGKTYLGLKVNGDSMYPKYLDGDTIIKASRRA